ncbi:uncharacterized protein LOC121728216 [Aricia agestis]|uniref:uncharacterized protein LOC121728216 n=1 Tax=Aricia agestis TaxID=91739 RepID=UPI001C20C2A4|nr:uncharacterized protein LOC121728216 [Aricia agestis]
MAKLKVLLLLMAAPTVFCATEPTLHHSDSTTCEEFSRFARFNPYSVVGGYWFMFYYWGPTQGHVVVNFTVPTDKQIKYLKHLLDEHVSTPINWEARLLLMMERTNNTFLLVEDGDRGKYHFYQPLKGLRRGEVAPTLDMRLKQVGDNRYIGMMSCQTEMVFAFSRTTDIPKKEDLQDAAATLGYRGRGGKSYLYQGHQWMPIPEADDFIHEKIERIKEQEKAKECKLKESLEVVTDVVVIVTAYEDN